MATVYYSHWSLTCESISDEMLEEHQKTHASRLNRLNSTAIENAYQIIRNKIDKHRGRFLLESIACEYVETIETRLKFARPSKQKVELTNLHNNISCVISSFKSLSQNTINTLFNYMNKNIHTAYESGMDGFEQTNLVFSEVEKYECKGLYGINENLINSLSQVEIASRELSRIIQGDKGGGHAGDHDSDDHCARLYLAATTRRVLKEFGLPAGTQKGGPVSKLTNLLHCAAMGEVESASAWPDRYAAKIPKLEREGTLPTYPYFFG